MSSRLDFAALEDCLKSLNYLFININRLEAEARYEEKRGGYGDVRVSRLDSRTAWSQLVAAKTIRLRARHKEPQRLAFRLARELKVWSGLRHPHVLTLLGYYLDKDYKTAVLISEYMIHGDLMDYIEQEKPSLNTRLYLTRDLTDGLAYLHRQNPPVRHGDLKPGNILINAERRAILADFGLSKALEEGPTGLTTSEGLKGTLRYYSPELIRETNANQSLPSDIWAWACLVLEVLADRIPYAEKKSEHSILLALMNDEPPSDAKSLSIPFANVKNLLVDCWTIRPNDRPSAQHCLRILTAESFSLSTRINNAHQHGGLQSFELGAANVSNQPLEHQTSTQQPPPKVPRQFIGFFLTEYNTWRANRRLPPYSPGTNGTLDALPKLFLTVGALGGCRFANEKNLWSSVGEKVGFRYPAGQNQMHVEPGMAESELFRIYQALLADFEVHWYHSYSAHDPNTIFPLPPQLQYLRAEIDDLVKNPLPFRPQPPDIFGAIPLLPQIGSKRGPNPDQMSRQRLQITPQATTRQKEPILHNQTEVTSIQKGLQLPRPANLPHPRDQVRSSSVLGARREQGPLANRLRQPEAVQAAVLDPPQKSPKMAPKRAQPPGHDAAAGSALQPTAPHLPSDRSRPAAIVPLAPGLQFYPEQVAEAQKKVKSALELFHNKSAFPPIELSKEQGALLKQTILQTHSLMKDVARNLVSFVVLAPGDQGELIQVARMMVIFTEQAQLLQKPPPDQRFIIELGALHQCRTYLATFLTRVKNLQTQALTLQNRQILGTPRSNPPLARAKIAGFSPTVPPLTPAPESRRRMETHQTSVGRAGECSNAPPSSGTIARQATAGESTPARRRLTGPSSASTSSFWPTIGRGGSQSRSETGRRKRNLEAISTGPKDSSDPFNTRKRARPEPQGTINTDSAEESDDSSSLEPDLGAASIFDLLREFLTEFDDSKVGI